MPQNKAKFETLIDPRRMGYGTVFQGGIVDNSEPWMIGYKNTPYARNFRTNGKGISVRFGFSQFGVDLGATDYPRGIAAYYRSVISNDRIITRYNVDGTHKLVSILPTDGTQTSISTASNITSDNRMNFLSANDSLYTMNGADAFGKINGTTYSVPNTGINKVTFAGSGLNDISIGNAGAAVNTYIITIDATGTPDTFKWNVDGGAYTTLVPISALGQIVGDLRFTFGATTGHTLNDSWTVLTGFTPSFGAWFDNSAFVSGDSKFPNRLFKSSENNPEVYSGNGADIFDSSYPIVGLASAAQTLYVFSENSIDMINNNSIKQIGSTLVYTSVPLEETEGAANHNVIGIFGRDVYYLSKSNKIKKVQPNGMLHYDCVEISHRARAGITKTMDTLDQDQSAGFCYVIPELQLIKWHLKTKGSSFNDICIVYNTEYNEFMVDDHKVFYGGVNYKGQNFTISQIEAKIYQDEYGYTDDDSPIQFRYDTKIMNFGDATINKCLWQTRTYLGLNVLAKIYQNIYVDGSLVDSKIIDKNTIPVVFDGIGTESMGTFEIGTEGFTTDDLYNTTIVRDKGYLRVKGKTIQLSYVSSELGARLLLQSLEPQIEMLHWLTTNHY